MFDLTGKIALVTGASGGIGLAVAMELAKAGADIACHYNSNENAARGLAVEIENTGRKAFIYQADLSNADSADKLVEETCDDLGDLHILINNAGVNREALLIRQTPELVQDVLMSNLASMLYLSRAAARRMAKNHWGRLIHMGSVVAHTGSTAQAAYSASKAGIEGMSRAIARELGPRNVTSNVIAPGYIDAGMSYEMSEERQTELYKYIALGRKGTAMDVAAAALYLSSEEAGYITGAVIHVNGGLNMA
ncbi:MAG TPA: 3-oxoacyl-ACP reductase family protein [bacterium]|jgi:3-oxoacyl-[acyl-carrier protein] reductase